MITIYTDGSSRANGKEGGFGVIIMKDNNIIEAYSKQYGAITNNQAELKAIIWALELAVTAYKNEQVTIYSDSAYCVNAFNSWIYSWVNNGWTNSKKVIVENVDLMKKLHTYHSIEFPNFTIEKCQGHNGLIGNEAADAAATHELTKLAKIIFKNNEKHTKCKIFDF